jgi:hypothetical protein
MLETKRDRSASVGLHDVAGLCDEYVFLIPHQAVVLRAHEIVSVGAVRAEQPASVFDQLRGGTDVASCLNRDRILDPSRSAAMPAEKVIPRDQLKR